MGVGVLKSVLLKWRAVGRICIIAAVFVALAVFAASHVGRPELVLSALRKTLGVSFFVIFAVGCIPETGLCGRSQVAPPASARALCVLVVLAASAIGTVYPWVTGLAKDPLCEYWYDSGIDVGRPWGRRELIKNWGVFAIDAMACWATGSLAMFCAWRVHPPSRFIRNAVHFLAAVWFELFVFTVASALAVCGDPSSTLFVYGRSIGRVAGFFVNALNAVWVNILILRRLRVLEKTWGSTHTPRRWVLPWFSACPQRELDMLIGITCGLYLVGNVFTAIALNAGYSAFDNETAWPMGLACCTMGLGVLHIVAAFVEPLRVLLEEASEASPAPAAEAYWAWRSLRFERNVIVMSMVMSMCDLGLRSAMGFFPHMQANSTLLFFAFCLALDLRGCIDAVSIAMLCGFFRSREQDEGSNCGTPVSASGAVGALASGSLESQGCGMARHPASGDPGWSEKVEELASRGVELARLLDFLEELLRGHAMPSFDPRRSTTNDVVRQAIIPLSRERPPLCGGRALATVWSGGEAIWPERMVTHSWSNLFLHLMAAIVCDALGDTLYYQGVAEQLCSLAGVERMRSRLRELGAMAFTYWVCAFSVNQHAGICGGFGGPPPCDSPDRALWERKCVDTASGQPHAICSCRQPKFFSDQPVQCEMNKFDDMLDLLMQSVPGFRQVIAMDGSFDLLRRCWCLAEIVTTSAAGMPQHTLMLSAEAMDEHYSLLATLDVRDCQASNPEDKDFILGKIHNVDRFNRRLQRLVFDGDGIFNRHLADPRDRVHAAARVAARVVKTRTCPSPCMQPQCSQKAAGPSLGLDAEGERSRWHTWPSLWSLMGSSVDKGRPDGSESGESENSEVVACDASDLSPSPLGLHSTSLSP